MKIYSSFAFALFISGAITFQFPPDTLWTKIFGGTSSGGGCFNGDVGRAVEPTDDGGFIISGWTNSYGLGKTDAWMVGTDDQGNQIWSYNLSASDTADEIVYDMEKTNDGGFILTGMTDIIYEYGGHGGQWVCGGKVLLIRTDELGDTLWTRRYDAGNAGWSEGRALQQTSDGGFVVIGMTNTDQNGSDVLLMKTDQQGNLVWAHIYGNARSEEGRSLLQTDDGGFILTGFTDSTPDESQRMWLIRTNELGDTLWTRTYIAGSWSEGRSVLQTSDGGFLIAGVAELHTDKTEDKSLMPSSLKSYLKTGVEENKISLHKEKLESLDESDYATLFPELQNELNNTGRESKEITHYKTIIEQGKIIQERDAWLLRTNELGDTLWTRIYGGPGWDDIHALSETNHGYILAGQKYVYATDSQDLWLIRVDNDGDTLWTTTIGDSGLQAAYDIKPTSDNGYIVTGVIYNDSLDLDQMWLLRFDTDITTIDPKPQQSPEQYVLEQNYPNPFNPVTAINYHLPQTAKITLEVYDILGQKVITLIDEEQSAGIKSIRWDGRDQYGDKVSSGIYIYTLKTNDFIQSKKMTLLK